MSEQTGRPAVSALVLAAQKRLLALRAAEKEQKKSDERIEKREGASQDVASSANRGSVDNVTRPGHWSPVAKQLPSHLGWENTAYANAIRSIKSEDISHSQLEEPIWIDHDLPIEGKNKQNNDKNGAAAPFGAQAEPTGHWPLGTKKAKTEKEQLTVNSQQSTVNGVTPSPHSSLDARSSSLVSIFAHTVDAIHRRRLDGPGRVWLLLRYLDPAGEGRVPVKMARFVLSSTESELRCFSSKRFQQLMRQGEGLFWERCKKRRWIYYRSEVKVAQALGLRRIGGWAVSIPILELTKPIKAVRALFYDAFHSGRGEGEPVPITRRILRERGGVEAHTQRKYEKSRQIAPEANYATLGRYSKPAWERAQHEAPEERVGGPAFLFIDYKGMLGKNRERYKRRKKYRHWHHIYIVRRIGNSYRGTLPLAKRGRRWTNHKLTNLCKSISAECVSVQPATGNSRFGDEDKVWPVQRLYHESAEAIEKVSKWAKKRQRNDLSLPLYQRRLPEPADSASTPSGYWQECYQNSDVDGYEKFNQSREDDRLFLV